MAAAQQRDQTIDHLQNNPNSLSFEYRPVPYQSISSLGDVSTGNFRPLVPSDFRKNVFESIHCLSHPGIKGGQVLITKRYIWPGYKRDIKLWCQTCVTCQQSKIQRHIISLLAGFTPSSQKFQHIHFDIVGPLPVSNNHCYLLPIVDRFSRWFEALPHRDITAKSCADNFILHFVARYGAPHAITVDHGTQFASTLWKELTKFLDCELIHTTAYNPKVNGLVERYHRVLKASLKAQSNPNEWYSNFGWILLDLRSAIGDDFESFHQQKRFLARHLDCQESIFRHPTTMFPLPNTSANYNNSLKTCNQCQLEKSLLA